MRTSSGDPFKRHVEREAVRERGLVVGTGLSFAYVTIAVCDLAVR